MPPQQPVQQATKPSAPDFIPDATPDFIPDSSDPALTYVGQNHAGFPVYHGTPTKPPSFASRLTESLGIPTSLDQLPQSPIEKFPKHPIAATLEALGGPAASALLGYGQNLVNKATEPKTPEETADATKHPIGQAANQGAKFILGGVLNPVGGSAVDNLAEDLGHGKYGPAGGDLLGTAINLATLGHATSDTDKASLQHMTAATGKYGLKPLTNTRDLLLQTRDNEGMKVNTVSDMKDLVNKAKQNINTEYGNALGPYANMRVTTQPVADAIKNLVTPDMYKTREGRIEIARINAAASEYERQPWTLGELDSRRTRLSSNLSKHNSKEPVSRYTAQKGDIDLAIDNATEGALRDVVYPQADAVAGKPTGYFGGYKRQQSNLIALESILNRRIDDLMGQTYETAGESPVSRLHGGLSVSSSLKPHSYVGGLASAVNPRDVLGEADSAAKKGFRKPSPVSKAVVMSYPARTLNLDQPSRWWEQEQK